MLKMFSEELYEQFSKELDAAYASDKDGMKRLISCLSVIRKYLGLLKDYASQHPFKSPADEIDFFRHIKPKFYHWLIYYVEYHTIKDGKPLPGGKSMLRYYVEQLKFYNRFFRQNEFHYQYYKLSAVELDNLYFIRGAEIQQILIPEVPDVDPAFSTSMDYLFSKFMAYEKLQEYLLDEIRKLSGNNNEVNPVKEGDTNPLIWTGDKTNLVEVIYGMYYTGQLNNGNASVSDIIKWMEQHFHIDLSRSYRNFLDIRTRKRDSPTRYLDKMRASIEQRVDEDNKYKPNRGIKLRDDEEK